MKKFASIFLVVLVLISMAACSNSTVSDEQAQKDIEKVLGDIENLPLDFEKAVAQIDKETAKYTSEESKGDEKIALYDGAAVYSTSRMETDYFKDGEAFTYKIRYLYFGTSKPNDDKYAISFTSAKMSIEIVDGDAEKVREHLKNQISFAPISETAKSEYKKCIDGDELFVTRSSYLWESFSDIKEEMCASVDSAANTFEIYFIGEPGRLYDDVIFDENEKPLKTSKYYFDENGERYVESIEEYTYIDDLRYCKYTYFYPYSETVKEVYEMVFTPMTVEQDGMGGGMTTFTNYRMEYYENGVLKCETYYDESAEYEYNRSVSYYDSGIKESEAYYDEEGNNTIIFYRKDGSMLEKMINGKTEFSDRREQLPLEETFDNGSKVVRTYDEDYLETEKWYTADGILTGETIFYKSGRPYEVRSYDYQTGKLGYIAFYYDTEDAIESKFITYDDPEWFKVEIHCYPNGVISKEIYYQSETQIAVQKEYDENGNLIEE